MKSRILELLVVVGLLFLAGCAYTEKSLQREGLSPLTESELKDLHSRTRIVLARFWFGGRSEVTYHDNGDVESCFERQSSEARCIFGSWRIEGNEFCIEMPTIRPNEQCCRRYKVAPKVYDVFLQPDGSFWSTITFID
jgi:hypothetical protein